MNEQLAETIGVEGYIYLYPLVLMDTTRRQITNVEKVSFSPLRTPADVFINIPAFPPADFRAVVRPNFDTLYSSAFLDLSEEPRIVSVPAAGDNYYLLPFYDMWGEVFACPGTRTTGGKAGDYAIVGPGWSGELPAGVRRYDAPTSWVWIIGRTEASVATYDKVHAFQAGLKITPLSAWGSEPPEVTGRVDASVDDKTEPLRQVFAMDEGRFFGYASELLQEHAPHFQDYPYLHPARQAAAGHHELAAGAHERVHPVCPPLLPQARGARRDLDTTRSAARRLTRSYSSVQPASDGAGQRELSRRSSALPLWTICGSRRARPRRPRGCRIGPAERQSSGLLSSWRSERPQPRRRGIEGMLLRHGDAAPGRR